MGQIGIWQIVIIAVVVVLLFGRGKISAVMGDVAKGINSFKKGLADKDDDTEVVERRTIDGRTGEPVATDTVVRETAVREPAMNEPKVSRTTETKA